MLSGPAGVGAADRRQRRPIAGRRGADGAHPGAGCTLEQLGSWDAVRPPAAALSMPVYFRRTVADVGRRQHPLARLEADPPLTRQPTVPFVALRQRLSGVFPTVERKRNKFRLCFLLSILWDMENRFRLVQEVRMVKKMY